MERNSTLQHTIAALLRATCVLAMALGLAGTDQAFAQTSSDACGTAGGNQYTVGSSCSYVDFDVAGSYAADYNPGTCSAGNFDDGWAWFVATATTTTVTFDPDNNHRPILHVFSGSCGSLTQVACVDAGSNGTNATVTFTSTVGTTYHVRVQRRLDNNTMNGRLCVWSPPANDDPCGAVALPVGSSCTTTAGSNAGAGNTAGIPAPGCALYNGQDVWFSFVAPASGSIVLESTAGSMTDGGMALYSATACAGTFTLIECDDDDGPGAMPYIDRSGLTPGVTYYVRFWDYGGGTGTFNICAFEPPPPPANDDPCGAVALAVNTTCVTTSSTNAWATPTASNPSTGCGEYTGGDVWYSFVAPANGALTIRMTAGSLTNGAMAVYAAPTCGGTLTLIECDDSDGPGDMPFLTFSGNDLVPGDTYYLRVWGNLNAQGTFDLCLQTAPSTGSCFYILRLFDLVGNGWGGSTLAISIGGAPAVNYTLATGDQDVFYIPFNNGQLVQATYTAAGGFQNEISYFVQLGDGVVFADGPTPATGLVQAYVAVCTPPSPPPSDCAGGITVCGDQALNANPNNTGVKADLDINNRGCLLNDERQGYWYHFSIASSGTLAFTIAPTNTSDDYDFAVWGPAGTVQCPPNTAPLRCNYSGATGNTGLSTSASNNSEGAGGSRWSNAINVTVGEVYALYISNWSRSGLAFDLTWQLTNGASLDCTILPVELLTFEGRSAGSMVDLTWATASESGTSHFEVERLQADGDFSTIGSVTAVGESTTTTHYELVDAAPLPGTNYYRLKMVDVDGATTNSDVVEVRSAQGTTALGLYPNPTKGELTLLLDVASDGQHVVHIHDASGRVVRSIRSMLPDGSRTIGTWVGDLAPSLYNVVVMDDQGRVLQVGRFLKE